MRETGRRRPPACPCLAGDAPGAQASRLPAILPRIIGPTWLEYAALRLGARGVAATYGGIRLSRLGAVAPGSLVVVCGLAGALSPDLPPGTVLIPESVGTPEGNLRRCDAATVAALVDAAKRLGFAPVTAPMLTAGTIVTGDERALWAEGGYAAADMELGLLPEGLRFASVRVVLDTPARPIADHWTSPRRALRTRDGWREIAWLARDAPRFALRAARVAAKLG